MPSNGDQPAIDIRDVVKHYGQVTALTTVSFAIKDNEFFTLLGPSGCGKTTILRLIAGFEAVTAGEIFLYGEEIEHLSPDQRPVNTVFQHYALFPHMTVAENVAFGLKRLKKPKAEVAATVEEMLSLVHLEGFAGRYPHQLSGGEQQRVALARALAPRPRVLLLDEPLSALDLKLRQAMRDELKRIQRETGITFVFVTHDQEEALAMSDRIAVMSQGEVQQIGSPEDIYLRPVNRFVADFIGDTNFIDVKVARVFNGSIHAQIHNGVMLTAPRVDGVVEGAAAVLSVRPENVVVTLPGNGVCNARIVGMTYLGAASTYTLELGEGVRIEARRNNRTGRADDVAIGQEVGVEFADDSITVLRA